MGRLLIIGCGGVAGVAIHKSLPEQRYLYRDLHCKPYKIKM